MPASSEMLMRRDTQEKKLRWDSHRPTGKLITYKWYLTLKKFLHQKDLNVTAFKLTSFLNDKMISVKQGHC